MLSKLKLYALTLLAALAAFFSFKKSVEAKAVRDERSKQNEIALQREIKAIEIANRIDEDLDLLDDDELDSILRDEYSEYIRRD